MKHDPTPLRQPQSNLELLLAPVAAAVFLIAALVSWIRDKNEPRTTDAPTPKTEEPPPTGIKARLGRLPVIGAVLKVQTRYNELKGSSLAAAVAFQSFLSLFPLLLVVIAALGFIAASDVDVAGKIAGNLGLTGEGAEVISDAVRQATENREETAPIGLIGLLWSGLGLVAAFQYALNQTWQVEERGMRDKGRGALWLVGALVLFLGAAAVTTVLNWLPGYIAPVGIAFGVAVNFALWAWTFKVLPNRHLPWRAVVPGALLGAVGMEVLKIVGGIYVPRTVASSSALYGTLGAILAVLAWLLIFSRLVVYAAVLNVVRWEKRVGTVQTTIEVPAGVGIETSDNVTRGGRVLRKDVAAA